MIPEVFRIIPGYPAYAVTRDGTIKSVEKDLPIKSYIVGGYKAVDVFYNSPTSMLPIARAVALAWVHNPDPEVNNIVNHIDGDKLNNWYENLEWTTYSGNNYHAVNSGLRRDNIRCKLRDFETGEIIDFPSIAQAAEYMGLRKDTSICSLVLKKFGALIEDRYEFRFQNDTTPWFYESRKEKIKPARFMVIIKEPDGSSREVYSSRNVLKDLQVYDSPYGKSIPALVRHAKEKYPEKDITFRDSYAENKFRVNRVTLKIPAVSIVATKGTRTMTFPSLTQAAKYFNVDRSCIKVRLNTQECLDGYVFETR
jgi:hypothetical protein